MTKRQKTTQVISEQEVEEIARLLIEQKYNYHKEAVMRFRSVMSRWVDIIKADFKAVTDQGYQFDSDTYLRIWFCIFDEYRAGNMLDEAGRVNIIIERFSQQASLFLQLDKDGLYDPIPMTLLRTMRQNREMLRESRIERYIRTNEITPEQLESFTPPPKDLVCPMSGKMFRKPFKSNERVYDASSVATLYDANDHVLDNEGLTVDKAMEARVLSYLRREFANFRDTHIIGVKRLIP